MKTLIIYIFFYFFIGNYFSLLCQQNNEINSQDKYKAWIDVIEAESKITVRGKFLNNSSEEIDISYKLITEKNGHSGKSSTKQSGSLKVKDIQESILSTTSISLYPSDVCNIKLLVYNKNLEVIAQDSLIYVKEKTE